MYFDKQLCSSFRGVFCLWLTLTITLLRSTLNQSRRIIKVSEILSQIIIFRQSFEKKSSGGRFGVISSPKALTECSLDAL